MLNFGDNLVTVSKSSLKSYKVEASWEGSSTTSLCNALCRVALLRSVNYKGYVSDESCLRFICKDLDIFAVSYLHVV